jgi:ribonuclease PH
MDNHSELRQPDRLRPVEFLLDYQKRPAGSVLASFGQTRVICAVSVAEGVPPWMRAEGKTGGWITAEYRMMPGSTEPRQSRKESGRSTEIQRLIGRSLRAVIDLEKLPGLTVTVDCDVLDADGGTRCASITGASVALELAFRRLLQTGRIAENPLKARVAAVSVGMVGGRPLLDLCYEEDSAADVDMYVVMTDGGRFVEVQGSGEESTFSRSEMNEMLDLAERGINCFFDSQRQALAAVR